MPMYIYTYPFVAFQCDSLLLQVLELEHNLKL